MMRLGIMNTSKRMINASATPVDLNKGRMNRPNKLLPDQPLANTATDLGISKIQSNVIIMKANAGNLIQTSYTGIKIKGTIGTRKSNGRSLS